MTSSARPAARQPGAPSAAVLPVLVLLLAMLSVQTGASIAKTMFPIAGPSGTVAIRIGFGTLILWIALRPWRTRVHAGSWLPLAVYGVSLGTMNLLYYHALERLPLGIAVALEFTGPLTVAILSSRRAIDFCWVLLAVAGLTLLLPVTDVGRPIDPLGALFALGAGGCWALYIVFGQKAGASHGAQSVALGSAISAALIVPIGVLSAPPSLFSPAVVLPGLAVAILSTALPYTLEMTALTRLPTRTFGILMSLEPAIGALSGLVLLGEELSGSQWTAIALIILASTGAAATARQKVPAPLPD